MNSSFQNKVAFVTGAANGIGRAAALAFAREGASVVVADIAEAGNEETARLINDLGGRALAVKCDVTRSEDVKAALAKTVEVFGRLDFAFNNAGEDDLISRWHDSDGFIDAELIESLIPRRDCDYYFCGPKPFMSSIYRQLLMWGIPGTQVHFEFFGPRQELEAVPG